MLLAVNYVSPGSNEEATLKQYALQDLESPQRR